MFQDLLTGKSKKYDLLFTELLPACECYLSIAWLHKIPIIATSPVDMRQLGGAVLGNPYHPSIIPHYYSSSTSRMTFFERLKNNIETMYLEYIVSRIKKTRFTEIIQRYFPRGGLEIADISLFFLNNHPSMFPLPFVPGIVPIAGVHLKPPQALPSVSTLNQLVSFLLIPT